MTDQDKQNPDPSPSSAVADDVEAGKASEEKEAASDSVKASPQIALQCIPLPEDIDFRNPWPTRCDMLEGPCACGAWHKIEDLKWRIENQLYARSERMERILSEHGVSSPVGGVLFLETIENLRRIVRDGCEDEEKIKELARPFLGGFAVDGDSYGVPTSVDIVEALIKKLTPPYVEHVRQMEREGAWLIEAGPTHLPKYLCVSERRWDWTTDSNKAVRFSRREDAEQVTRHFLLSETTDGCRVSEHAWDDFCPETAGNSPATSVSSPECPKCKGRKVIEVRTSVSEWGDVWEERGCPDCNGTGRASPVSSVERDKKDLGNREAYKTMDETPRKTFILSFNDLAREVFENAKAKGWWDTERNDGEMIALMHSELSEALEAIRNGNPPDDKVPVYLGTEAELADVVIRIMDMAHARKWRVAEAVIDKMAMNKGRPYKHGRKAF